MLAWIFNGQTQLLAVLFTSSCWFVPQVADCQTPNASYMTADSLPVANIPLPNAGSRGAQKPTSAGYNDAEISIVQWQMQPRTFNVGTQKSVQASSVCPAWISALTHLESTPWQSPVLAVNTIPGNDAGRQCSAKVVPVDDQIVRIQWSNEPRSPRSDCAVNWLRAKPPAERRNFRHSKMMFPRSQIQRYSQHFENCYQSLNPRLKSPI